MNRDKQGGSRYVLKILVRKKREINREREREREREKEKEAREKG